MTSHVTIERLEVHSDPRGWVVEPAGLETLAIARNVHVVLTEPGCVRGNHYHPQGTEVFVVVGPALIRLRDSAGLRDVDVPEGQAFRFTIPPGVAHAIRNPGPRPMCLIAFNTVVHDPARPDVVRDVLLESSPLEAVHGVGPQNHGAA